MANTSTQSQQRSQQQLRRAAYIHVSDLITSGCFNDIDHEKLEREFARVNDREREENPAVPTPPPAKKMDTRFSQKRHGFNICCLVGKVKVVVDARRVDGSPFRLAEVEVGDETGTVILRARDEQVDIIQEVSERSGAIVLRNCTLECFQGHTRLAITKWGKISAYPDQVASTPPPPSKINEERNFSLIDLTFLQNDSSDQLNTEGQNSYQSGHRQQDRRRDCRRDRGWRKFSGGPMINNGHYFVEFPKYQLPRSIYESRRRFGAQLQALQHSSSSSSSTEKENDTRVQYGVTNWIS